MLTTAERFQIEWACERLIRNYTNLNDIGAWDELADLFIEDAEFYRPSAPDEAIIGRETILNGFKSRPLRVARHVLANTVIDALDEKTAKGYSLILLYQANPDENGRYVHARQSPLIGAFHDEMVLESGAWKFSKRKGSMLIT